jgi:hypothetical protein
MGKAIECVKGGEKKTTERRACRFHPNSEYGSNRSTITESVKEDELVRTVALSSLYSSAKLDEIERDMRKQRGN